MESKNWSVVRIHAGYLRYDTPAALTRLRALHSWLRLFVNFFQPSLKLQEKVRSGARVTKRYDRATTPYDRLLISGTLPDEKRLQLKEMFQNLNPADLHRQVEAACGALRQAAHRNRPAGGAG